MEPTYRPISTLDWDEVTEAFNAAYEGYVVPLRIPAKDLRHRCDAEDTSPDASVVVRCEGANVGIAFVAVRGERARLAAFGLAPAWRGRGLGSTALRHALTRAPDATRWELEVIEHNTAALRLYERTGFRVVDRLYGYERPSTAEAAGRPLQRVSVREAAERMAKAAPDDLPWQLDARTLAHLREPWFAVHDGEGCFAFINAEPKEALSLRWFFDAARSRADDVALGRLIRSIAAAYAPAKPIRIAPLTPSRCEATMSRLGFVRQSLTQLLMIRD